MKLFSRGQTDEENSEKEFQDIDLPKRSDFDESYFEEDPFTSPPESNASTSGARVVTYGIKNTIELMRRLPTDNNEVVVSVVKQTLESMNIGVEDIIKDASTKEARIRQQHKSLEQEVKSLELKIAQRNQQMSDLTEDLKETIDVRERLQLAVAIDEKAAPIKKTEKDAKANNNTGGDKSAINNQSMASSKTDNMAIKNPVIDKVLKEKAES